ncbi:MAG: hypothetical protein AAF697_00915 [Pseudomonadota bacterium]
MTVSVIPKFAFIAVIAAVAAWLPVAISFAFDGPVLGAKFYLALLLPALIGSFGIGLPVALVTFHLSWRHLVYEPSTLIIIATLAGVMMMLTSFVLLGDEGLLALGLPSFVASATFAILGWFWILRPLRNSLNNPPQEKDIA